MDVKYTPERRKAFGRVVHAARAFVRAVDEFGEDNFSAVSERHVELINALDAEGRAWDEGPAPPPVAPEIETADPPPLPGYMYPVQVDGIVRRFRRG